MPLGQRRARHKATSCGFIVAGYPVANVCAPARVHSPTASGRPPAPTYALIAAVTLTYAFWDHVLNGALPSML